MKKKKPSPGLIEARAAERHKHPALSGHEQDELCTLTWSRMLGGPLPPAEAERRESLRRRFVAAEEARR